VSPAAHILSRGPGPTADPCVAGRSDRQGSGGAFPDHSIWGVWALGVVTRRPVASYRGPVVEPPGGTRSLVAPRALVPGALAVVLGVAAHGLVGGAPVGPASVLVLLALVAPTTALALRGRPSRRRMVAVVVATQLVVHALLLVSALANRRVGGAVAAFGSSDGMFGMPGMGDLPVLDTDAALDAVPASGAAWSLVVSHLAHDLTTVSGVVMMAAHLVAAVLLGLWLARGEQLLVNLRSLALAPLVARALRRSAAVVVLLLLELARQRELLTSWRGLRHEAVVPRLLVVSTVDRRGPPALLGAVAA